MRAVIIGTDFMKDTDGSFKALETNTNIQLDVIVNKHFNQELINNFVLENEINEIHIIANEINSQISEIDYEFESGSHAQSIYQFLSSSICYPNNINLIGHATDRDSITIPYVEDADNKLIIRLSYDTTALIDDTYTRDNWEFLKLIYDTNPTSIPKCYINDEELGIDSIGETLRDNGNHPNYCIKKRITPSNNRIYPILYKINTLEELEEIKSNLEVDEYIQEYIYNTEDLIDNKTFHYRSIDLIYGSELNSINFAQYQKTNIAPIVSDCDFNDENIVQKWDRPRYLSKVLNGTTETSVKLDANEGTKIILNDNTSILAENLQINNTVKSIKFTSDISYQNADMWSGSFEDISQNYTITSSVVIEKDVFDYTGPIINIEFDNGSKFSDVPHAKIFKSINNIETSQLEVVQINYENLQINDNVILFNNNTNTIETKTINSISYSFENIEAYRINIEDSDLFFSMEETENQSIYGILTHNYDFDCRTFNCGYYRGPQGPRCSDGQYAFFPDCGWADGACLRCGGIYSGCDCSNCYPCDSYSSYGCYFFIWSGPGYYCNGDKSDIEYKENLNLIGKSKNGINIYEFNYKNEDGLYQGVIAQELIGTEYEVALCKNEDDLYIVDYDRIDVEFKKIK